MKTKNLLTRIIAPLVLILLLGYFGMRSMSNPNAGTQSVFFEYSAKCNMWEVRDKQTGRLLSTITEGIKSVYELSTTRYAALLKIDGRIVGYDMDRHMNWSKPIAFEWVPAEEAKEIYGSKAKHGLAEFSYSTKVVGEFKACTTDEEGDNLLGLPLVLYEGTLSKKPTTPIEEREFNGLEKLHGQPAIQAYGDRVKTRPVYNNYKTDAVSEVSNNDKKLRISNGTAGNIVIEYSSDRMGEIDVLINQEFEQLVTSRHQKNEQKIRMEIDPSDWPPNNFTISVFKAGTDYGVESRLHRLNNGKIEIDFDTEQSNKEAYSSDKKEYESKEGFVTVPGELVPIPEQLYRTANFVLSNVSFKVADPEFISFYHDNLRSKTENIQIKNYISRRFKEEANAFGFEINYDKNEGLSISSIDKSYSDIVINNWLNSEGIPESISKISMQSYDKEEWPLLVLNNLIVRPEAMLEELQHLPLEIKRYTELNAEVAQQRFGEDGKYGALIFKIEKDRQIN